MSDPNNDNKFGGEQNQPAEDSNSLTSEKVDSPESTDRDYMVEYDQANSSQHHGSQNQNTTQYPQAEPNQAPPQYASPNNPYASGSTEYPHTNQNPAQSYAEQGQGGYPGGYGPQRYAYGSQGQPHGGYNPNQMQYNMSPEQRQGEQLSQTSLILGIISIFIAGVILGPLAIIKARDAERLGIQSTAGKVTGWIGLGLGVIQVLYFIFLIVAIMVGVSAGY